MFGIESFQDIWDPTFLILAWLFNWLLTEIPAAYLAVALALWLQRKKLKRELRELQRHENRERIRVQWVNIINGNTLITRQLAHDAKLSDLFSSQAAQDTVMGCCARACLSRPLIEIGEQRRVLREDLFNWPAGLNGNNNLPLREVIVLPLYWDLDLDTTCIRMIVMEKKTLLKMADWDFCLRLKVESETQWARVIALHHAAKTVYYDGATHHVVRHWGYMELGIRDDWSPLTHVVPSVPNWGKGETAAMLKELGLPSECVAA